MFLGLVPDVVGWTLAIAAASLAGVQGTHRCVRYHFC